ncbi:TetR-like C-terminal domain-containing protein [Streptomyces sp. NPDC060209]|uniref:TetR-like C-terminal domain-containing protein n=1 Tax=Streptomyces sp. NPDC060209 TaxID=3347073 RepID=UPI003662782F
MYPTASNTSRGPPSDSAHNRRPICFLPAPVDLARLGPEGVVGYGRAFTGLEANQSAALFPEDTVGLGYVHAVGDEIVLRDTGDIRADLLGVIAAFARMVSREPAGPVFAQLIGAAQTDRELASQFDQHYFGPRRRQAFTSTPPPRTATNASPPSHPRMRRTPRGGRRAAAWRLMRVIARRWNGLAVELPGISATPRVWVPDATRRTAVRRQGPGTVPPCPQAVKARTGPDRRACVSGLGLPEADAPAQAAR